MSNGGSLMDSIKGLFSSGRGGGTESRTPRKDPVEARMDRVEQVAEGVRMAAAALEDDVKELRREAEVAADAVLEAARERAAEVGGGGTREAAGPEREDREIIETLGRCIDVLEELHYRVLRVEVHPDVQSEEERGQAAERASEAADRAREAAGSLTETAGA